jgi:hypothetical protein
MPPTQSSTGQPAVVGVPAVPVPLVTKPYQPAGLKAFGLSGDGMDGSNLVPSVCWAADSQSFYVLEKNGTLRRISADGQTQLGRIDLGAACGWLTLSLEGPIATLSGASEACLVNHDLTKVLNKMRLPAGAKRVVSAPTLAIALTGAPKKFGGGGASSVALLELKSGSTVKEIPNIEFQYAVLSPDGQNLFAQGGSGQLVHYKLAGDDLVLADKSPGIAQNGQSVVVSPDSRFVCLPSGGGNYPIPGMKTSSYSTYIFPVTNLKTPKLTVHSGAYPRTLAFDPAGKWIYAHNAERHLVVFDWKGAEKYEYTLPLGNTQEVRYMAAQPQGSKLVIVTETQLWLVEVTAGK